MCRRIGSLSQRSLCNLRLTCRLCKHPSWSTNHEHKLRNTEKHPERHTERHIERQTDRRSERQTEREADREIDREAVKGTK